IVTEDSHAWDGVFTGKIGKIDVTEKSNLGFRVFPVGAGSLCGTGTENWGYVHQDLVNYNVMVSTLQLAFAAQKEIGFHFTRLSKESPYCIIGYISVGR
ncbi:MAG: hypothetical protein HQK51_12685, partial [Oligoflexia bacterium]|nr:hypothetical protein [Oligoflexia bacterium]